MLRRDIGCSSSFAILQIISYLAISISCAFTEVAHSHKHTYTSSSYSSLDWVLSHWAHFTVRSRFICVCVFVFFLFHTA